MSNTNRDYLTGLYTRQELHNLYGQLEKECHFHLMFMDVDNFKNVNDVYGHNKGDVLLKSVANILIDCAPQAHAIRLGGDEFVLLFVGEYSREYLCQTASRIIERIVQKEGFADISTPVSSSIGILHNETIGSTLDEILLKSDMAMYYAKTHGKGNYVIFNDIADRMLSEVEMEKRQQRALDNGEFEIRYLPYLGTQNSRLKLSQACVYWNMPNGDVKEQSEFLPLFEKNGFIRQLSQWMITQVLTHLQNYHEKHDAIGKIGIRISRLLLLERNFPRMLQDFVKSYKIEASELSLEVMESDFTHGCSEMLHNLENLKNMGFHISVIGVGSDFKSLVYWDKLAFDTIIFDASYIQNALRNVRGRQIIKTLFAMGRELKMQVMVDGITNREDALFLGRCGCNAISGSYYSVPIIITDYFDFVKDKIMQNNGSVEFHFRGDLISGDKKYAGKLVGENIQYAKGITDKWGALLFPGGACNENVLELPAAILEEPSYTICMWLKPLANTSWTSSFYARYQRSFCAFSPFVVGGNSIFRVSEDTDINGFHDAIARQIPKDTWTFVCMTYADASEICRTYINGRKAGYRTEVPSLSACRQILLGGDPFQPSFQGYISGVSFYDYVKSEEEIRELYDSFVKEQGFSGSMEEFWME